MKLINKIFKRKLTKEQQLLLQLSEAVRIMEDQIIAMARLNFTKPERLEEETRNIKANTQYLKKMVELKKKGGEKNE
jgi:hypothetical protein